MALFAINSAQETLLIDLLTAYDAGDLVTNQTITAQLATLNANWQSVPNVTEIELDNTNLLVASRRAKTTYVRIAPLALVASQDWEGITETSFEDGDILWVSLKANHIVTMNAFGETCRMATAGDFVILTKSGGVWKVVSKQPSFNQWPFTGNVTNVALQSTETSFTAETSILNITATIGNAGAVAIYTVTSTPTAFGILSLYVDGVLVATGDAGAAPTPATLVTNVAAGAVAASGFSVTADPISETVTVTDTNNRGTSGNTLILSSEITLGVVGSVTQQFTGGTAGTESSVTIDTINGVDIGRGLTISNGNPTQPIYLGTGGNIDISSAITIPAKTFLTLQSADGTLFRTQPKYKTATVNVVQIDTTDSPYTVTGTEDIIQADTTSGAITINFPTAATFNALVAVQKKDSSVNAITLVPNGAETLQGAASKTISVQYDTINVFSDGSNLFYK